MLKRKCDQCDSLATHHSVEIVKGQKIEKHLCDKHAGEAGLTIKAVSTPINELLTNFVKLHSGVAPSSESTCPHCGITFTQFREHSLLGCPDCYESFETTLLPLLERAHEGGTQHMGKVPARAGAGQQRQVQLRQMRKQLAGAVETENYELAARLRDEIQRFEDQA